MSPARPCLTCGALGPASYCSKHTPAYKRRNPARGSGGKAATFRRQTLAKTHAKCAVIGCFTPWDGVVAHHLVPLADGGPADGEGIPLCRFHHKAAHAAQRLLPMRVRSADADAQA